MERNDARRNKGLFTIRINKEGIKFKVKNRKSGTAADSVNFGKLMGIADDLNKSTKYNDNALAGIIYLGLFTGFRIGDILNTCKDNVNTPNGKFPSYFVAIETQKTKQRIEKALPDRFMDWFFEWQKQNDRSLLFANKRTNKPFTTHWVNKRFKALNQAYFAKYDVAVNLSSHSIRKTFGRHYYNAYGLVQTSDALGHKNTAHTRTYLKLPEQEQIKNHLALFSGY